MAQKGETLIFEASFKKANQNYVQDYAVLALATHYGEVLARGEASIKQNGYLEAVAPYTGSYVIALESGRQMLTPVTSSHPYSIAVADRANLFKPDQTFRLWNPAGNYSARVTFWADGIDEAFVATFKNKSGDILGQYHIFTKQTVSVPLGHTFAGEIIELSITAMPGAHLEDVKLRVESGLEKYMSPFANALVPSAKK